MKNIFLFNNTEIFYHESWKEFIVMKFPLLDKISSDIGNDYTPDTEKIFLFLKSDLSKVKCIILGQDPYPSKGDATGRAFEVGNYNSWTLPTKNTSLSNILKLVVNGNSKKSKILSVGEIREEIASNDIKILRPNKLFKYWQEDLGVLLLNTALTCKIDVSASHKDVWKEFTEELISFIDLNNRNIYWYLFGNHAKSYQINGFIKYGKAITSSHPRINSRNKGDFLMSDFFTTRYLTINWKGI